jgi:tetratricopeptide (TPR) repeat protein
MQTQRFGPIEFLDSTHSTRCSFSGAAKLLVLLMVLAATQASGKGAQWIRASSEHFKLITDGSAASSRNVIRRFEEIRQVLLPLAANASAIEAPVPVLSLTTSDEIRRFRSTGHAGGFYVRGGFGDTIVLHGSNSYDAVFHEYVHLFLNRNSIVVPIWFEEGLAELYSTLSVAGKSARVGEVIRPRIALLRSGSWMPLAKLFAITKQSREYGGEDASLFYAESWALSHMLVISEPYQKGLRAFLAELALQTPIDQAFQRAYNKDIDAVSRDLQTYIARSVLPVATIELAAPITAPEVSVENMREPAAALVVADVLAQSGQKEEAPALLSEVARRHPNDPDVETGLGETAMREGNDAEAQVHFDRAIQLGSRNAVTYYDYATLLRDNEAETVRFRSYLERAVRFDPTYFNAQYLLGYTNLRTRKYDDAQQHLKRAAELSPSRMVVWEQLALAYRDGGKRDQATAAARMAAQVAASEAERERTAALMKDVEHGSADADLIAAPEKPSGTPAEAAEAPLRALRSDASAGGELIQVDCLNSVARLVVRSDGRKLFLLVRDPGAVLITGSGKSSELPCGVMATPRRVQIAYQTRSDTTYRTVGDVTAIEFK